jgi:hypothetical protein
MVGFQFPLAARLLLCIDQVPTVAPVEASSFVTLLLL